MRSMVSMVAMNTCHGIGRLMGIASATEMPVKSNFATMSSLIVPYRAIHYIARIRLLPDVRQDYRGVHPCLVSGILHVGEKRHVFAARLAVVNVAAKHVGDRVRVAVVHHLQRGGGQMLNDASIDNRKPDSGAAHRKAAKLVADRLGAEILAEHEFDRLLFPWIHAADDIHFAGQNDEPVEI